MKFSASLALATSVLLTVAGCAESSLDPEIPLTPELVAETLECNLSEPMPSAYVKISKTYTCGELGVYGPWSISLFEADSNSELNEWIDLGAVLDSDEVIYVRGTLALVTNDVRGIEPQLEELFGPPLSIK